MARAKGFDAVMTVFATFGISKVSEIADESRAELLAALEGAL